MRWLLGGIRPVDNIIQIIPHTTFSKGGNAWIALTDKGSVVEEEGEEEAEDEGKEEEGDEGRWEARA